MPAVARINDLTAGANVGAQDITVFCNGILVQLQGDHVSPHAPCPDVPVHCAPTHVVGSPDVFIGGIPIIRVNDTASCGHAATTGSPDVFANDN